MSERLEVRREDLTFTVRPITGNVMSIFDRLGNLGKGLLQNVFTPGDENASPGEYQERLRRAFEGGVLTAEEYREKLKELSARLAARATGAELNASQDQTTRTTTPRNTSRFDTTTQPRTTQPRTTQPRSTRKTTESNPPEVEDRSWEETKPLKRTL